MPRHDNELSQIDTETVFENLLEIITKPDLSKQDAKDASNIFKNLNNKEPNKIDIFVRLYKIASKQSVCQENNGTKSIFKAILYELNSLTKKLFQNFDLKRLCFPFENWCDQDNEF